MGLGSWPDVSLLEARTMAQEARAKIRNHIDPIDERRIRQRVVKPMTVEEAVRDCFKSRQAELKGDGKSGRWLSPLTVHVFPSVGNKPIEQVDQHTLVDVLSPIWQTKTDAARKSLNRINLTLKHAAALGLDVDLQATMKARALLGKQRHVVTHIPSLHYADMPKFYNWLCSKQQVSVFALRFLILTLARTSEVRFARVDDVQDGVWIIPAENTKSNRENRVPLTDEALNVILMARTNDDQSLLFPSPRGKALSDAAMSKFMKDNGYTARPHGFRASFRTWVEEQTDAQYEVAEAALGHTVDGEVARAYQRSDRFKKRKKLLEQWMAFLTEESSTA